jgi:hypothetical protein
MSAAGSIPTRSEAQHKTAYTKSPAVDQISMPVMTRWLNLAAIA